MKGLIGKKVGMTSIFLENGKQENCTVVEMGPCTVIQKKTVESDGYDALQLGFGEKKDKHTTKAEEGHFKKAGVAAAKKIIEFRDYPEGYEVGDKIGADIFAEGEEVAVVGRSKGKGFQGVVKRHGFGGVGMRTHGQHNRERAPGSIGAASYPAKVFKGMRMGGQTGNERVKTGGLRVVRVMPEENILLIRGSVPGPKGGYVIVESSFPVAEPVVAQPEAQTEEA